MKIQVHPAAAGELQDAAAFYVTQANDQLGPAFIAEFERVALFLSGSSNLGLHGLRAHVV